MPGIPKQAVSFNNGCSLDCPLSLNWSDVSLACRTEKSRGDAFEVFTEAYLATQRKHDAETVWPLASLPTDILDNLKLAMQDYGVDGVLKTRLGKFSAYQVKFRTGRPALTWRELSTFMGLADSPNIYSRILLTNCDELASVLNDRQGFFCIRGSDLDRLEPDDFKTIEAWLADSLRLLRPDGEGRRGRDRHAAVRPRLSRHHRRRERARISRRPLRRHENRLLHLPVGARRRRGH